MKRLLHLKKRTITLWISMMMIFACVLSLNARNGTDHIHLFASFPFDTPISERPYIQGGFGYGKDNLGDNTDASAFGFGARGGYPINDKWEIVSQIGYVSAKVDWGTGDQSESGISDLHVIGRYHISNSGPTSFAVGPFITVPIGSEDILQGNLNIGGYGAVRHSLDSGLTFTGNVGLESYEVPGVDREIGFNLSAGAIYPASDNLAVIAEFVLRKRDEMSLTWLSGGINFQTGPGALLAVIGLGLNDDSIDLIFAGGYEFPFK